jgi:hypothetical protein
MSEELPPNPNEYDHLFALPPQSELLANLTATLEDHRDERLELLFAPRPSRDEVPELRDEKQFDFPHLFEQDEAKAEELRLKALGATAAHDSYRMQFPVVSAAMKDAAWSRLGEARRDPIADAIVAKYEDGAQDPSDKHAAVDTIRKNAELRYELGSYYLRDKLPQLIDKLPRQVAANDQKRPKHMGYKDIPQLGSQEYVAMLALAMLDGTYAEPGADTTELYESGDVKLGEHRAAANLLIDSQVG